MTAPLPTNGGHFLLKDFSLGHCRLSFEGLGAIEIDVHPAHMSQQEYCTFSIYRGCLSVGFSADSNQARCLLGDFFVGCQATGKAAPMPCRALPPTPEPLILTASFTRTG